jgi:hypothetical protein
MFKPNPAIKTESNPSERNILTSSFAAASAALYLVASLQTATGFLLGGDPSAPDAHGSAILGPLAGLAALDLMSLPEVIVKVFLSPN